MKKQTKTVKLKVGKLEIHVIPGGHLQCPNIDGHKDDNRKIVQDADFHSVDADKLDEIVKAIAGLPAKEKKRDELQAKVNNMQQELDDLNDEIENMSNDFPELSTDFAGAEHEMSADTDAGTVSFGCQTVKIKDVLRVHKVSLAMRKRKAAK